MFQANCYNVMIVSPSDVSKEREIVKDGLYRWNELNSRFHNIVFSVLGYNINAHADSGIHPQESINHQLLQQADLIIAIFWTKLGTPTTEYSSGSVEEITKHIQQGKKALIYFSNKQISPNGFDLEQYQRLQQYKKSIQFSTFYKDFSSEEEFEKLLNNDIQLIANELKSNLLQNQSQQSLQDYELLSSEEQKLLILGVDQSRLIRIRLINGTNLNGQMIGDQRSIAEIEEAIEKLENKGFIKALGNKHESFEITAAGYRAYDNISEK